MATEPNRERIEAELSDRELAVAHEWCAYALIRPDRWHLQPELVVFRDLAMHRVMARMLRTKRARSDHRARELAAEHLGFGNPDSIRRRWERRRAQYLATFCPDSPPTKG